LPARQRDELFEALAIVCGWDYRDVTRTARGRLNQALAELREVEATPEDVLQCARAYREMYSGATLTPQALVANWPDLKQRIRPIASYDPEASMLRALSIVEPAELEAPVDDTVTSKEMFQERMALIGQMPEDD
jgi:hypothetical protein